MTYYVKLREDKSDGWLSHGVEYRVLGVSRNSCGGRDFLLLVREKDGEWPTVAFFNEKILNTEKFKPPKKWIINGDLFAPPNWSYKFLEQLVDRDPDCYSIYYEAVHGGEEN